MTTKEWLSRGRKLNEEINALLEARNKAFALACRVTVQTEKERVSGSSPVLPDDKFVRYVDYTRKIDAQIDALYAIQQEILDVIMQVKNRRQRVLLLHRYVNYRSWSDIMELMRYEDVRGAYYLHGRALSSVNAILKK